LNASQPISLNEFTIVSALIFASSVGLPGLIEFFLKNKSPASRTK